MNTSNEYEIFKTQNKKAKNFMNKFKEGDWVKFCGMPHERGEGCVRGHFVSNYVHFYVIELDKVNTLPDCMVNYQYSCKVFSEACLELIQNE